MPARSGQNESFESHSHGTTPSVRPTTNVVKKFDALPSSWPLDFEDRGCVLRIETTAELKRWRKAELKGRNHRMRDRAGGFGNGRRQA